MSAADFLAILRLFSEVFQNFAVVGKEFCALIRARRVAPVGGHKSSDERRKLVYAAVVFNGVVACNRNNSSRWNERDFFADFYAYHTELEPPAPCVLTFVRAIARRLCAAFFVFNKLGVFYRRSYIFENIERNLRRDVEKFAILAYA